MSRYNGFEITANANKFINIPMHIPIIPYKLRKKMDVGFAAVHAGKLFSSNGEKIAKRYIKKGIATELNITKSTKNCLEFYVKDTILEGFWDKRHELYKQLSALKILTYYYPIINLAF